MKTNTPKETVTQAPIDLGLTSDEVERATEGIDPAELNLECSDLACHIAINEFELLFLSTN